VAGPATFEVLRHKKFMVSEKITRELGVKNGFPCFASLLMDTLSQKSCQAFGKPITKKGMRKSAPLSKLLWKNL
jgi:hypothetical protein